QSVLEGERALVLVAGLIAVLCVGGRKPIRPLLGGVGAGIVLLAGYALLTRLFPDRIGTYDPLAIYRLATPVGYWNGLGILAVIGSLIAFGVAARSSRTSLRAVASASLVVLVPVLYFTFGRGSWIALGVGVVLVVVLDPRRLQALAALLAYAPAPVAAVAIASQSHALTHPHSALGRAAHDGHRLALVLLGLIAFQALVAFGFHRPERRLRI